MPDSGGKILSKKEIASCFFRPGSGIRTNFKRADDKEPLFPPAWFQVWLFVSTMDFPAKILLLERPSVAYDCSGLAWGRQGFCRVDKNLRCLNVG